MSLRYSDRTYTMLLLWAVALAFVLFSGCSTKSNEMAQISEPITKVDSVSAAAKDTTRKSPPKQTLQSKTIRDRSTFGQSFLLDPGQVKSTAKPSNNDIYTFPSGGSFRPYKQFLVRPDTPVEVSYTLVYFPAQPSTTKLTKQYESVCQMWKSHFYAKDEILGYLNAGEEPIPVYWLLRDVRKPDDTCDNLVRWYDFVRATSLLKKKHRPKGPALVALIEGRVITMDLSGLSDEEDLDRAFSVWKEHIVTPSEEDEQLNAITMVYSAKKALGVLASILQIKS